MLIQKSELTEYKNINFISIKINTILVKKHF